MAQVSSYTGLLWIVLPLIDAGQHASADEVKRRIEDGSVFDWLKETYPDVDLGLIGQDNVDEIREQLQSMVNAIDTGRKFGVTQDGLVLLAAYAVEGVQQSSK